MKYTNSFILLLLLLTLGSCHKDSIYSEMDEEVSPPILVEATYIVGEVKNTNGQAIAGAHISVYQNEKKIGELFSDQNGKYSTANLPIDPSYEVTLEFQKEAYDTKYRRIVAMPKDKVEINATMGIKQAPDGSEYKSEVLLNPSDTNYVKLWGYAKLQDGTPIKGVYCTVVWKYTIIGDKYFWFQGSARDYSDENGYFELLVPKDSTMHFRTSYTRYPKNILAQCPVQFQNLDHPSAGLPPTYGFNDLGKLYADTEVVLRNDIVFETIGTRVIGIASRCDGSPVQHGIINGYLMHMGLFPVAINFDSNYVFGPNGEFELLLETCNNDQYTNLAVNIIIEDTDAKFKGRITNTNFQAQMDVGSFTLCEDLKDYPDKFEVKLGDDPLRVYEVGGDSPSSGVNNLVIGFNKNDGTYGEDIFLLVDNIDLGVIPIKRLELWKDKKIGDKLWEVYETTFDAKPEDVVLTITKMEGKYVYGNVNGVVNTPQGPKELMIDFEIYNK